jgi:hypothetical protein
MHGSPRTHFKFSFGSEAKKRLPLIRGRRPYLWILAIRVSSLKPSFSVSQAFPEESTSSFDWKTSRRLHLLLLPLRTNALLGTLPFFHPPKRALPIFSTSAGEDHHLPCREPTHSSKVLLCNRESKSARYIAEGAPNRRHRWRSSLVHRIWWSAGYGTNSRTWHMNQKHHLRLCWGSDCLDTDGS